MLPFRGRPVNRLALREGWIVAAICLGCAGGHPSERLPAPPENIVVEAPLRPLPLNAPLEMSAASAGRFKSTPFFVDAAASTGLNFTYDNGARGQVLMVESIGGGCGWLDYDNDGRPDAYLCQGGNPVPSAKDLLPSDHLYRQVAGQFVNVTAPAGIYEPGYSMGVAIGDYNNDGFDDIYITNVGPNVLLQNRGDGTFCDVTVTAGVGDLRWSSSAAWSDLDLDGDLDLYVCNYVVYDPAHPTPCPRENGSPGTCHPRDMTPAPDECYFNNGDGTFSAEARQRGLFGEGNKALGVVVADFDQNGWPDVYVANDTTANFMFINQGYATFEERAVLLGCAVSREGLAQASMGVALGDFDRNGWLDLYCTHFTFESNTLYKSLGLGGFQDVTGLVGLHAPTLMKLGFGTVMTDFNQDGHEDIFVTNGHIDDWRYKGEEREMEGQLFSYAGPRFVETTQQGGEYFRRKLIGRGVATSDYDDDGDLDLLVVHQGTPAALLRNDSQRGHWLKLRFTGRRCNRQGVGTRVVVRQHGKYLVQELAGGTSFASSHEKCLIFGLGELDESCQVEIHWPGGGSQSIEGVSVDCAIRLIEPDQFEQGAAPGAKE